MKFEFLEIIFIVNIKMEKRRGQNMVIKIKHITLLVVLLTIILSVSVFVYAIASRLYHKKTPSGTFVFQEIRIEDDEHGYLYQAK